MEEKKVIILDDHISSAEELLEWIKNTNAQVVLVGDMGPGSHQGGIQE
jgi:hypothetical protein